MKILLLGPPASGKGTIGKMLSEELDIPLISAGNVLRTLPPSHPRYHEVHEAMDRGHLVPQDFLSEVLRDRLSEEDCADGFVLDGWGRALIDLEYFDPGFDKVVVINVSDETVLKRITGRRICTSNGEIYNIYTLPKEQLEECTGKLVHRHDDTIEIAKRRLEIQRIKDDVLAYFKPQNNLVFVDGEPTPDVVFKNVLVAIK